MPPPEQHTIVRFSMRSLLAITSGVAVVMAVAGPFIRTLETEKQRHLLFVIVSVAGGMGFAAFLAIRRRQRLGLLCGRLLLALDMKPQQNKNTLKWIWLLLFVPAAIFYFYLMTDTPTAAKRDVFSALASFLLPFLWSMGLARYGLAVWAEGCSNEIEFCENGIAMGDKFRGWDARAIRQIYWSTSKEKLVINFNRTPITIPVPLHQREAVDAILEHYYRPQRQSATDQT